MRHRRQRQLEPHYAVGDVAEILGETPEQVRKLIHTKQLPAEKKRGEYRISLDAFERYCAQPTKGQADKREAVFTRRGLGELVLWALGTAVSVGVGLGAERLLESGGRDDEARQLFRRLLGFRDPQQFDYVYGRPSYWGSYHPYHRLTGDALLEPLGLHPPSEATRRLAHGLPQQPHGDKIVFGGPNSTIETARAWGFQGSSQRELKRVDPVLPLRWYGISAESELGSEQANVIVYGMGRGRVAQTKNWPIVDLAVPDQPLVSARVRLTAEERASLPPLTVPSRQAFRPESNWLIITRVPNFLDPHFLRYDTFARPTLLVVEGVNGVGTRAAELLVQEAGLGALEDFSREKGAHEYFQALFEAYDYEPVSNGTHRFRRIGYEDLHLLPAETAPYMRAHRDAMKTRWAA